MNNYIWSDEAFNHAKECYPQECCGLILDIEGTHTYWKCKNISGLYKEKSFVMILLTTLMEKIKARF